jgi:hypothetical protein
VPTNRLKLPTTTTTTTTAAATGSPALSDALKSEMLKTRRAGIDAGAKVEVARLQVAKEAITALKAFADLRKSFNDLEGTRIEWEGRIATAETAVEKAQVDLKTAQEKNQPRMEELRQAKEAQKRILELFDDAMAELREAGLEGDAKTKGREYLLRLSEQLVKLKG